MKVNIGTYPTRLKSTVHDNLMDKRYGFEWPGTQTRFENFVESVEDSLQSLYNIINNVWFDERTQKVDVKIERWDTWSMDHTLAFIVLPMLKQLQSNKPGAPFAEDEDVPSELRSTSASPKINEWDTDDNHFLRWDWVMEEMIWAFEQKCRDDWESDFYRYEEVTPSEETGDFLHMCNLRLAWEDREGREAHQLRMTNGFRLFGKYYENLWD